MFSTIGCFVVFTFTLVCSNTQPKIGEYTRDNACIGGSIEVISKPNNLSLTNGNCNAKYDKKEWELEPYVKYPDAMDDKLYTVMMLDPDAPNLKDGVYYLHWLLSNVMGEELRTGDLSTVVSIVAKYKGPAPPEGTGDHKYQFIIYKQEEVPEKELRDVVLVMKVRTKDRHGFNLTFWLEDQNNFTSIVGPITGVQFLSNFGNT